MCGGTYPKWLAPRQLLEFMGEPIIARTIRLLRENGVDDIAISSMNTAFTRFGVPVLSHANSYSAIEYNNSTGYWCDAFYPTDEPTCYIFGDVVFSPEGIKKIVETETDDIIFFGSAPPFGNGYLKKWIEPFAFKVANTEHLKQAVEDVKRLDGQGRFARKPIAWEVWNVISRGPDGNVDWIDYGSYVHINDWTCDIDHPDEVGLLEAIAIRIGKESSKMDEYKAGTPSSPGWYDCLIDGEEEDRLQWWICVMNPKKRHWKNTAGEYMDAHDVKWAGKPGRTP